MPTVFGQKKIPHTGEEQGTLLPRLRGVGKVVGHHGKHRDTLADKAREGRVVGFSKDNRVHDIFNGSVR